MLFLSWFFRRRKAEQSAKQAGNVKQPARPIDRPPVALTTPLADQRTRLSQMPYLLPKDALEDNRLDYQHYVMYLSIGNHYTAPLPPELFNILDIGTGTGIWALEMAHQFPTAQVVGVDLSAISFKKDLPTNCKLSIGNVLEGLPFPDQTFDYTHQRFLVSAILAARWPDVIRELVRVTAPGGWIELLEINNVFQNAGPETKRLSEWITNVSKMMGFDVNAVPSIESWLKDEGLPFVETQDIVVPLGEWGGRAGTLLKKDLLAGFEAAGPVFCAKTSIPPEAFAEQVRRAAAEWEKCHTSYTFHAIYGKRAGK